MQLESPRIVSFIAGSAASTAVVLQAWAAAAAIALLPTNARRVILVFVTVFPLVHGVVDNRAAARIGWRRVPPYDI